jgi:tetratricopeptide (TPR) repeat protein
VKALLMNKRAILVGVAAVVLLAAGAAWKVGFFERIDDTGNCVDVVAVIGTNPERAAAVCLRQAKEGDAIAETDIGKMYVEGRGVAEDFAEAKRWFEKAAAQNQPDGLYNLGLMYADGEGVPQDYAEAIKWYRLAADRGQADAQNSLGLRYKHGEGVGQDYVQAHKWFALSVINAIHAADRARALANLDAVAKLMTPDQVAEAQKLTREWKPVTP